MYKFVKVEAIGFKLFSLVYKINFEPQIYDIVEIKVKNREALGIIVGFEENGAKYDFEIKEASKSTKYLTSLQKILLLFISKYYMTQIGITAQIFTMADSNITESSSKPHITNDVQSNLKTLSSSQALIFNQIQDKDISLIFGITGSGKTEIYFHAIYECLKQGKQALFLMPEISLTPQMEKRLESVFKNLVGIWHSKCSPKKKKQTLLDLQNGKKAIIAGARSALFLPYQNLGLIIVDEEHDDSYKSGAQPKYNARDLSIFLSSKDVKVILGSATPSPKSYYLATKNKYLFELNNKYFNSNQDILFDEISNDSIITQNMLDIIKDELDKNKQIIIFIPTRANFRTLLCRNCFNKILCSNCSITLSVHNKKKLMVCHYCNFSRSIPNQCEVCGCPDMSGLRIGTEEVRKRLQEALRDIGLEPSIEIFDSDYINTYRDLEKTLNSFNNKEIDILIGTQMIAKGHDYHNVSLSIILGMDYMFSMQDYRAYEKGFSLLYQVAGRSSRKEDGKILVQIKDSEFISRFWGSYESVLDYELDLRCNLYPPFFRLALITFCNSKEKLCSDAATNFAKILYELKESQKYDFEVVGIAPANIAKVQNRFYYQILLRSKHNFILQNAILAATRLASENIVKIMDIDIDPLYI